MCACVCTCMCDTGPYVSVSDMKCVASNTFPLNICVLRYCKWTWDITHTQRQTHTHTSLWANDPVTWDLRRVMHANVYLGFSLSFCWGDIKWVLFLSFWILKHLTPLYTWNFLLWYHCSDNGWMWNNNTESTDSVVLYRICHSSVARGAHFPGWISHCIPNVVTGTLNVVSMNSMVIMSRTHSFLAF
jgi:hypothetical protein